MLITDLVLDVGNTRTKMGLFAQGHGVKVGVMENGETAPIIAFLDGVIPTMIALGSVSKADPVWVEFLRKIAAVLEITGSSPAPVRNAYGTLSTLGADRLANVTAGMAMHPGRPFLVIDAGSCITYDVCSADGVYLGGAISPGMRMRARAMNAYSARLPLVELEGTPDATGTTTENCLEAGIHFGIVGEMREFIRIHGTERPGCAVLLTGGDGLRFARALEIGIFAHPFLTLEGYHALLVHHRTLPLGPGFARSTGGDGTGSAG